MSIPNWRSVEPSWQKSHILNDPQQIMRKILHLGGSIPWLSLSRVSTSSDERDIVPPHFIDEQIFPSEADKDQRDYPPHPEF